MCVCLNMFTYIINFTCYTCYQHEGNTRGTTFPM